MREQCFELLEFRFRIVIELNIGRMQKLPYDWMERAVVVIGGGVIDERPTLLLCQAILQSARESRFANARLTG